MAELFELLDEAEHPDACTWNLQRVDASGRIHRHELRLTWADYDLFAPDGSIPPVRVADAVASYMLSREEFQPLPNRLDAAVPRRRIPGADEAINAMIQP